MPTRVRRRAEQKKHQARIYGSVGAVGLALTPFIIPRLPLWIATALVLMWLVSWPMARHGYKYGVAIKFAVCLMLVHGLALAALGCLVWPRITVNPAQVLFRGYPNETFNFSVKNGRSDDVYDVQVPFLIGYNRHLEDDFSAKVMPNGDPPQRIYDDYNYCFGRMGDGNVHHVQKNEREVLIVRIGHLPPFGLANFSVTYAGGPEVKTGPGRPNFISEPYSYSSMQSTIGVRGDYRICKFAIRTDGAAPGR